jgi:aspartate carbamoyltransferase catalytic subunit
MIGMALGCETTHSLDGLEEADAVYALRMQHERMRGGDIPSLAEYARCYRIGLERMRPGQVLMHPGPVNRGVEVTGAAVDSPASLITRQVSAGVAVRMAVLYELVAGSELATPRAAEVAA